MLSIALDTVLCSDLRHDSRADASMYVAVSSKSVIDLFPAQNLEVQDTPLCNHRLYRSKTGCQVSVFQTNYLALILLEKHKNGDNTL